MIAYMHYFTVSSFGRLWGKPQTAKAGRKPGRRNDCGGESAPCGYTGRWRAYLLASKHPAPLGAFLEEVRELARGSNLGYSDNGVALLQILVPLFGGVAEHLSDDRRTSLLGTGTAILPYGVPILSTIPAAVNFYNKKEVGKMPEKWTGNLIGEMHNQRVTYEDIANELGVTKSYISMILSGRRKPEGIRERMEAALAAVIERRSCTVDELLKEE